MVCVLASASLRTERSVLLTVSSSWWEAVSDLVVVSISSVPLSMEDEAVSYTHLDVYKRQGQLRVNTQIIDAQGGHTEVNEPGNKLDDSDFLRLLDQMCIRDRFQSDLSGVFQSPLRYRRLQAHRPAARL